MRKLTGKDALMLTSCVVIISVWVSFVFAIVSLAFSVKDYIGDIDKINSMTVEVVDNE